MNFKPGCHPTSRPANTWEHTLINSEFDDKLINQREMGKFNQKRDEKPALTCLWHITPAMLHCQKNIQPVMFSEKIAERCILFHQIECLTMVPGDVQPLGHLPTICPVVCSLCMKRGKSCFLEFILGTIHTIWCEWSNE